MPVNPVHTDNAPAAIGAYSQATLAEGFLFTSGQLGLCLLYTSPSPRD